MSSKHHGGCAQCFTEGYDSCYCKFCNVCGDIGHWPDQCERPRNTGRPYNPNLTKTPIFEEDTSNSDFEADTSESDFEEEISVCEFEEEAADSDPKSLNERHKLQPGGISRAQNFPLAEDLQLLQAQYFKRQARNMKRRNNWSEVAGREIQTLHLKPVDRTLILHHMLEKVRQNMAERYSSLLQSHEVEKLLEESLNPTVRQICEQGQFNLTSIVSIGQSPELKPESGVYLHILWTEDLSDTRFWLYVGQAQVLQQRIQKHKDPKHRARNMGLHYAIWGSHPRMYSTFVTLSIFKAPLCAEQQLILNLSEMWMCLVFQTLTSLHLNSWLPENASLMWRGNHLNVALPIWQSFTDSPEGNAIKKATGGRFTFQQYLQASDPTIRAWAEHARDAFNDLRNSPDPDIRKYWWDLHSESISKSEQSQSLKVSDALKKYLEGAEVTVSVQPVTVGDLTRGYRTPLIRIVGDFKFVINKSVGVNVRNGTRVFLQLHLLPTTHPHPYVVSAPLTDPASRLGVRIRGQDGDGEFDCWLAVYGECNAYKMNTLVDLLEGIPREKSRTFQRRWYTTRASKRKQRNVYT